jgi:hypothetical protein
MASHTPGELADAAATLATAARRAGLEPERLLAPPPEPVEELAEIETALVRAERLAAVPSENEPGGGPFDVERGAGVPFDQQAGARPVASEPTAGTEIEIEIEQADGGSPAELFDFERAA